MHNYDFPNIPQIILNNPTLTTFTPALESSCSLAVKPLTVLDKKRKENNAPQH